MQAAPEEAEPSETETAQPLEQTLEWFTHGTMIASALVFEADPPMFYTVFGIKPFLWYAHATIGPAGGIGPNHEITAPLRFEAEADAKAACERHHTTGRWEKEN